MTKISSTLLTSKKVDSTKQNTVYREPTYHLHLTPQEAPHAFHFKSLTKKSTPYQNLDHLVDKVMQDRYGDQLEAFSKSKIQKLRKQVAHSLMDQPDQKSALKIQMPLAEAQGLTTRAKERLEQIVSEHQPSKKVDLTPLVEFIFSECKEESVGFILAAKLSSLLGSKPEFKPLKEALFREVCLIRRELDELTRGTTQFYRPPQSTDGLSYLNHQGEVVPLVQTIPSSYDRDHSDVQNGRFNLDNKGHVIYSTGRIETERKAKQVLSRLIQQTFGSGQITTGQLSPQNDGSYLYPVVIENLINVTPTVAQERKYLLQQNEVLKSLSGSTMSIVLPSHQVISVKLKLMHFSTQTNYNIFLGQSHGWSSTGSDIAEQITQEGSQGLEEYYTEIGATLPSVTHSAIEYCLKELKTSSRPRDRLILRAFICELLNIPYHVHCKSSKDRTALVAAIKKALHLWLKTEAWRTQNKIQLPDPREFFNSSVFREYSEAALFENLPLTDQGVGISGVLDGKLYTQNRGFSYLSSFLENPFIAHVLSDRHLHTAPILERLLYSAMLSIASLIATTLYIALSPIVLAILYCKYKENCLEVFKYIFLGLLALPAQSGFRRQWLNHDSKTLKERSFFLERHPTKEISLPSQYGPLTVPQLNRVVEQLSPSSYEKLLKFLQTGDANFIQVQQMKEGVLENSPDDTSAYILKEMANNWTELKKTATSSRLSALLGAAQASNLALFQLTDQVNSANLMRFTQPQYGPLTVPQLNRVVEQLSPSSYEKLLKFLQTGDANFIQVQQMKKGVLENSPDDTSAYILKEMANNWTELKKTATSSRLSALLGAAQTSNLALFQLTDQVNSANLMRFTQQIDLKTATDEYLPTLIREIECSQGFTLTHQFAVDYHRMEKIIVKTSAGDIPFLLEDQPSLTKFHQALKKIPLLNNEEGIPLPLQDMLTQKTTLSLALVNYAFTIDGSIFMPSVDSRIFTIEQGNNSKLIVRLYETAPLLDATDPQKKLGTINYRCDFDFILDKNQNWKATLANISPMQFKWDDVSISLSPSRPTESQSLMIQKMKLNQNIELLRKYVEAIALHTEQHPVQLKELTENIQPLLQALSGITLSADELNTTEFKLMTKAYETCKDNPEKQELIKNIITRLLDSINNKEYTAKLFRLCEKSSLIKDLAVTKI